MLALQMTRKKRKRRLRCCSGFIGEEWGRRSLVTWSGSLLRFGMAQPEIYSVDPPPHSSPGGCDDGIVRKQCTPVDSPLCLSGHDRPHRSISEVPKDATGISQEQQPGLALPSVHCRNCRGERVSERCLSSHGGAGALGLG